MNAARHDTDEARQTGLVKVIEGDGRQQPVDAHPPDRRYAALIAAGALVAVAIFVFAPDAASNRSEPFDSTPPGSPAAGTRSADVIDQAVPFSLLALGPGEGDALTATIIDGWTRSAVAYEAADYQIQFETMDFVAPFDTGWVSVAGGTVRLHDAALAPSPLVVQAGVEPATGVDREVYALEVPGTNGQALWVVVVGRTPTDPTIVKYLPDVFGRPSAQAALPPYTVPVIAVGDRLLLNARHADGRTTMYLTSPDGTTQRLWDGVGIYLRWNHVAYLDCVDPTECAVRWSLIDTGPLDYDPRVASTGWVYPTDWSQPGTSVASPDGGWMVLPRSRIGDAGIELILVDFRDFGVRPIVDAAVLGTGPGPDIVWSADSQWVLLLGDVMLAMNVDDGQTVDLAPAIPSGASVVAVHP